ncbi:MAG: PAS domain S-box protein [Acidaminobacter sp.]|nr:PAS domain S-box protein [Acidaminobacter sp.]
MPNIPRVVRPKQEVISVKKPSSTKEFIVRSHKRCDALNIGRDRVYSKRILDGDQLFERMSDHQTLIGTAEPFMNQLYNFVKGTDFFAILTDEEGCILSIIGDESILTEAFSYKMMPGAFMDETNIGTNAMGTALVERMPVQVSGDEHYIEAYHKWTCSASPICDTSGKIIGSLDLTGYSELVHPHTLGMVVAAAKAIERMLQVQEYNVALEMAKLYNDAIIDSISAGILTADLDGTIKTVSHYVPDLFGYTQGEIRSMKVWQLFEGWEQVLTASAARRGFSDEEVVVNSRKNKAMLNLSTYPIINSQNKLIDIIMVFKDVKKIRKLANRIMGRKAVYTFDKIIGENRQFTKVVEFSKKIADSRSGILILGESGTGKELFAQAIHNHSDRREEPFVALNCGAIPKTLIEAELFGYEEGAFTGAKTSGNPGKFEIADGGTLFLDEVGEMPLDMQTRLLRVLEEGTISRVGSMKEFVVDVRIIAATNKDLKEEVAKGNFRKDLYYRLNVLPIILPPLRQRKDDIPLLIEFFTERISKRLNKKPLQLSEDQIQQLQDYDWPGNIRELENYIELLINTESVPEINRLQSLDPVEHSGLPLMRLSREQDADLPLNEIQKRHIIRTLDKYNGNISLSAKALGIARNTLYRNIEVFKIDCSTFDQ